jgi:hypothetical protein
MPCLLSGDTVQPALGAATARNTARSQAASSRLAMRRADAGEACELVGAELPHELRQAGVRQLWIVVPFAVVVAAIAPAWSGRRPSMGDR